jgi:phage FluMu protein Com
MLNNYCEEQKMQDNILEFHEKELAKIGIPSWANVDCPFCNKELPLRSIRSISLKLNTRNMGDVCVEVFCPYCSKMDTVYFRSEVDAMKDFLFMLEDNCQPKSNPVIEEEMYKLRYNNLMEKMAIAEKGEK